MKQPTFGPILIAAALFGLLLFIPNSALLPLLNDQKVEQAATSLDRDMFQGIVLQKRMLEEPNYLPMYGSSEFSRMDPYHPSNYFRVNNAGFTPFLIGRGGTQSLTHFLSMAAVMDELPNEKVVFILSPQWFIQHGLDEEHFAPNFSSLQAYDLVFNKKLSPRLQKEAAKRLLQYDVVKSDTLLTPLLEGIVYDDAAHRWKANVIKPFGYVYKHVLERKDIVEAITVRSRKPNTDETLRNLPWEDVRKHAELAAATGSSSNAYGIEDKYYKKKIKPKLDELKGYKTNEAYTQSPEYGDLQLVMDLLKETNTKALFISIPVNGPWYDYAEFPKERRAEYYAKMNRFVTEQGFPIADFTAHEDDPGFMKDTIHVGWKGWVYIDEAIQQFYEMM